MPAAATQVEGWIAPGFEPALEVADEMRGDLAPGGAAFAAYVEGRPVADLWLGEAAPGTPWEQDTLAILFSSTKGLTTLAAQLLVDRGQLDLDVPVADYWPEFAANGKVGVLVRHVLSHTSGVVILPEWWEVFGWDGRGLDRYDDIADRLAAAAPAWEPGAKHGYHGLTYGWLVGELVRRVTGQNLGEFFDEAVAQPLGLELHIGTPPSEHGRVARLVGDMVPGDDAAPQVVESWRLWHDPDSVPGQAMLARPEGNLFDHMPDFIQSPHTLAADFGSGGATGTARSLARMYALLAEGGTLDGVRLLSPERVAEFAQVQASGLDEVVRAPWRWALGYHLQIPGADDTPVVLGSFGPNTDRAYGHCGFGGQIGGLDPDRRLAVAYVSNKINLGAAGRCGPRLVDAVVRCLDGQNGPTS